MKKGIFLSIIASSALLLSACSNNSQTGAVIGSLVGAGIGKSTANHRDKRAAIGAVVGGLVGAAIGQEQDRKLSGRRYNGNGTSVATTSPYYNGSSHSHSSNSNNGSVNHSHGNRSHAHAGGAGKHAHNGGAASGHTAQHSHSHTTQREVVYVERPYYRPSVVIGTGYYHYPRRYHRNKHYHRHNKYHHRNRHYNRHHRVKYRNRHRY